MTTKRQFDVEELKAALLDVLDGVARPHEIQENTGVSFERALEISALYQDVLDEYKRRKGMK